MNIFSFRLLEGLKGRMALLAAFMVTLSSIAFLSVRLTQALFDSIGVAKHIQEPLMLLAAIGSLRLLQIAIGHIQRVMEQSLSTDLNQRLEKLLVATMSPRTVTRLETPQYQHDLSMVRGNFGSVCRLYLAVFHLAQQLVLLLSFAAAIMAFSWYLPLVVIFYCLPYFLYELRLARKTFHYMEDNNELSRTRYMLFDFMLKPQAQREIILNGIRSFLVGKWDRAARQGIRNERKFRNRDARVKILLQLIEPAGLLAIQLFLLHEVVHSRMSIGEYIAATTAIGQMQNVVFSIARYGGEMKQFSIVKGHFQRFMERYALAEPLTPLPRVAEAIQRISLHRLTFHYPDRPQAALRLIDFQLKLGETVAIVGENGSGKSTMAKILMGLHEVQPGQVMVNGTDASMIDAGSIHAQMSYVAQDYTCFPFTLHENVTFTDPGEQNGWLEALERDFPGLLPPQLAPETMLGMDFQGSSQLSGGQWQRVALARALYRNSSYLILDEATSALDPQAEASIMQAVLSRRQGKTTVIVTHRLSLCQMVDRIVVLHEGCITEMGSHLELMSARGKYFDMVATMLPESEVSGHGRLQLQELV